MKTLITLIALVLFESLSSSLLHAQTVDFSNCPACSSRDVQLAREVNTKYLGLKANNPKAPSSYGLVGTNKFSGTWGYGGVYDFFNGDNWLPLRGDKQILCGKVNKFEISRYGDENDWNIIVLPNPGFEDFIADAIPDKRSNWHGFRDDWYVAANGQYMIEVEITPDESRYGNPWFPNSKLTPLSGKDICAYGPFVKEESHGNRPEIHPSEIIWWKEGENKTIALIINDDSNRFNDNDRPTPPSLFNDDYTTRNVTDPDWKAWGLEKDQQAEISIPFQINVAKEAVYLSVHALDALNFSRNAVDQDATAGSKYTMTYKGASVLTVEETNSIDPFTSVTFRNVCFDKTRETLQGFVVISTFVGNGNRSEGVVALQIDRKMLEAGDIKAIVVGDLLGTWKTYEAYDDRFSFPDVISSDQSGKGIVDGLIDFDGNGKTDLFVRTNSGEWLALYDCKGRWRHLNTSAFPLSALRFGDINGDGKTDVLADNDGMLQVSYGGTESWTKLQKIGERHIQVADFNGDGKTDVVAMSVSPANLSSSYFLGAMNIMWSAKGGWQKLNNGYTFDTAGEYAKTFRFGDFNGDGISDLFRYYDKKFMVYWNGTDDMKELQKPNFNLASVDDLMFVKHLTMPKTTDVIYVNPVTKKWTYNSGGKPGSLPMTVRYNDPSTVRFGDLNSNPATEPFTVDFVKTSPKPETIPLPNVRPVILRAVIEPEYKTNSLRRASGGNGLVVDYVLQEFPGTVRTPEKPNAPVVVEKLSSKRLAYTVLNLFDGSRTGVRSLGLIQSVPIGRRENELTISFAGSESALSRYEIPPYSIAALTTVTNETLSRPGSWEKWNRLIKSNLKTQFQSIATSAPPTVETVRSVEFELIPFYSTLENGEATIEETATFIKELNEIVHGNNPARMTELFGTTAPFDISWTFELVDTSTGTTIPINSSNFKISNGKFANSKITFSFPNGTSDLLQLKAQARVTDALGNQLERRPFEFWNQRARFKDRGEIERWLAAVRAPSGASNEILLKRASYFAEDNLLKPNELLELFDK
jgi:FG-GAP-like repeat